MNKIGFFFTLAFFCALPALAQKGTKFTFSNTETADDFPLRGKSITVEGQLVAVETGNSVVNYEIRYYAQKKGNDLIITKVQLQEPMLGKSKTKTPTTVTYFYISPNTEISTEVAEDGFYNLNSTGQGIPYEQISVSYAAKDRRGFEEGSYGFRQVRIGKFKSKADFEKFKKMLPQ